MTSESSYLAPVAAKAVNATAMPRNMTSSPICIFGPARMPRDQLRRAMSRNMKVKSHIIVAMPQNPFHVATQTSAVSGASPMGNNR